MTHCLTFLAPALYMLNVITAIATVYRNGGRFAHWYNIVFIALAPLALLAAALMPERAAGDKED